MTSTESAPAALTTDKDSKNEEERIGEPEKTKMKIEGAADKETSNEEAKKNEATEKETKSKSEEFKIIEEGSAAMKFAIDDETAVFYNPVQVQNRDLSILMITLYVERLAIRKELQKKRKELKGDKIAGQELKDKLKEYEKTLVGTQLVANNQDYRDVEILDALAASGLRSIRYWKEIPGVHHVTINDLEQAAVDRAMTNLENNELGNVVINDVSANNKEDTELETKDNESTKQQRPSGIKVQLGDATAVMYQSRRPKQIQIKQNSIQAKQDLRWDVIDLDPYGSAAPFLDGAVQAAENGGLLCVTCTDMAALGGSHPETCFGRYSSFPIPNAKYLQEMALRILLKTIAETAAKYGRTMKPILSVGMNFYVRVFVEIHDSKAEVTKLSLNIGNVYQSTQCPSFHIVPHCQMGGKKKTVFQPARAPRFPQCEETGSNFKVGGPFWLGPLHDQDVIQTALDRLTCKTSDSVAPQLKWIATRDRLRGLLTSVSEELPDIPLYYNLPSLSQALAASSPSLNVVKAGILNAGYRVSGYHKDPQAIKTDAPNKVVWDVMRTWVEQNPPNKPPKEGSTAAKILATKPTTEVDFTIPKSLLEIQSKNVVRFPLNPEPNWGPKKAATGKRKSDEMLTK